MPPRLKASSFFAARDHAAQFVFVCGESDFGALADVDVRPSAPGGGQPGVKVGKVSVCGSFGHEAGAQPAVGNLPRQAQHRRRERGQIDRNVVFRPRRQPHRHRLAARARDLELFAGVRNLASREHLPHDVDGSADTGQRPAERDAVQALDHLRTGGAQPEQEPPVRQVGQCDRGLGNDDGRPSADLHDAGAEQHPIRKGGKVTQRRWCVRAPRLRDPTDIETQVFGLNREVDATDIGQLDRRRGAHQRTPRSASLLIAASVLTIAASNSRIRTKTIFSSLSGIASIAADNPERPGPICIQ